jgi:hypothetical protein
MGGSSTTSAKPSITTTMTMKGTRPCRSSTLKLW